jgi:adenylylsulfate kinase-like enzyme
VHHGKLTEYNAMVIWVIGLAGSGKTTVANMLCDAFRAVKKTVVLLDGDNVREVFGNDLGFTKGDRLSNARRIRSLCYLLDQQNINVVCAILSISQVDRDWCRTTFTNYKEIYLDVSVDMIEARGDRDIYRQYKDGETKNVVGYDIKFEVPERPDFIIENKNSIGDLINRTNTITEIILSEND